MPLPKKKKTGIRKSIISDKPVAKLGMAKADTVEYQQEIEKIYLYIKDGMRSGEIFAMMTVDDPSLDQFKFDKMLEHAYVFAKNALQKDRDYVFQLHMNRYEDIYEKVMADVEGYGKPQNKQDWRFFNMIITKYTQALSALNHKEDLLGLHDKRVVFEFNDQQAVVVEKEDQPSGDGMPGYNLNNLTFDEQLELLNYIKEARTIPIDGIQRVVIKTTRIEINTGTGDREIVQHTRNIDDVETVDVKFEEMPDNVVKKMTNIPEKEDEPEEEMPNPIRDLVPKHEAKRPNEIKKKIQDDVMKSFKDKLKNKK